MKSPLYILSLLISAVILLPQSAKAQIPDTFLVPIANGNTWVYNYRYDYHYSNTYTSYNLPPASPTVTTTTHDTVKAGTFQVSISSVVARNDSTFFTVSISDYGQVTGDATYGYNNNYSNDYLMVDSVLFVNNGGSWSWSNPWYLSYQLRRDTSYNTGGYPVWGQYSRNTGIASIDINSNSYTRYSTREYRYEAGQMGHSDWSNNTTDSSAWITTFGSSKRVHAINNSSGGYSTIPPSSLPGNWEVHVRTNSREAWTLTTFNSITIPPAAPVLVSPSNNAINLPVSLSLIWRNTALATSYDVEAAIDSGFTSLILQNSSITDTQVTLSGLDSGVTYYWRVRARNAGGTSPWASYYRFTTVIGAPPSVPVLVFPADSAADQPMSLTLIWNRSSNAASYHVQVATDTGFTTIFSEDSTLTDTLRSDTGLAFSTVYYWRVSAKNAGGVSAWSEVRSFTTMATRVLPGGPPVPTAFSIRSYPRQLSYTLPQTCQVRVRYFNLRGRQVATLVNRVQGPGYYTLRIDRALLPSGVYCMVFEAGRFVKRELSAVVGK